MTPGAPAHGLSGHLHLVCARDREGRSYLRSQSFRAPIHLSKPHEDEGTLIVNVVNPTAGLFAGDRIECRVAVESGARLLLTAPSASRAHCSSGGVAELVQEFEVAAGASLDCWPELFIPQGGARYRQRTAIRVAGEGELLFFETLAPGRVAMGEAFAYHALDWETDVFLDGDLIARERYRLSPADESLRPLRAQFATGYYASCFVISPRFGDDSACWPAVNVLHDADAWIGSGRLRGKSGWVIKLLAADSLIFRRKLEAIRRELYRALGRPQPALRRGGQTSA